MQLVFSLALRGVAAALLLGLPTVAAAAPTAKKASTATVTKTGSAKRRATKARKAGSAKRGTKAHARTPRARRGGKYGVRSAATRQSAKALQASVPQGSALAIAALLNYADGTGKTPADQRIAKALDRLPGGRATAKRLALRIRAQPSAVRTRLLGKHARLINGPTSTRSVRSTARTALAMAQSPSIGNLVPVATTLPPQNVGIPNTLNLNLAAVQCEQTDDDDGADELIILSKLVRATGSGDLEYTTELSSPAGSGHVSVTAGATGHLDHTAAVAKTSSFLLVTALAEADGDAAATRADLEFAVALARQLAVDTGGDDLYGTFAATLAYTQGMLQLSKPGGAPSLRSQWVRAWDLSSWWSASPEVTDGVQWKASIGHTVGGGRYTLLYDVPSELPVLTTLDVTVHRARRLGGVVGENEYMVVRTMINGASVDSAMGVGVSDGNPILRVQRQVQPGPVEIELELRLAPVWTRWKKRIRGKLKRYYCGAPPADVRIGPEWIYKGDCHTSQSLAMDIAPGNPTLSVRKSYDPETGKLTGLAAPRGGRYVFAGTQSNKRPAEITISVSRR